MRDSARRLQDAVRSARLRRARVRRKRGSRFEIQSAHHADELRDGGDQEIVRGSDHDL
jgi:hypothetical protein